MTQVKSRDTMRDSARLAIMARIGSANSLYEVFSFADRAIYPESGDPARLRVLSVFGPVVAECVNFDRRTVIDHWRTIWHVINGKDRASQLAGFLGCSVGGVSLEYRPDIVRERFARGDFMLPNGPDEPAPWLVTEPAS